MRDRQRIQPYLSVDLRRRLKAYAAAQDVTETAIAEAALKKYLEPDRTDEALVVRRLDAVVQVLGRVEERLEVVGEAIGRFAHFSFRGAPRNPMRMRRAAQTGSTGHFSSPSPRRSGRGRHSWRRCAGRAWPPRHPEQGADVARQEKGAAR